MKIITVGEVITFVCNSCGCKFAIGKYVVNTPDNGGNFYANCPMCGADCHTDWGKMRAEKQDAD